MDKRAVSPSGVVFHSGGFAAVGGIETSARNLLCELQRRGIQSSLLCWGPRSDLLNEIERSGVGVTRVSWRWGCRANIPDFVLLLFARGALRTARIVLFGKPVEVPVMRLLRRIAPRDTRFVLITAYRPGTPTDAAARQQLRSIFSHYDAIWVQSALFEADLRTLGYSGPVHVVPYMPEPLSPLQPYPAGPIRIGFLGRLVYDKNVALLLEAFARVLTSWRSQQMRDARLPRLVIAGDGPERRDLERTATDLGLQDCVEFLGTVAQRDAAEVINGCHFFVFTSRVEGQCLAALEILARGRPLVATRAGALPEILNDRRLGILVDDDSPASVAKAMEAMVRRFLTASVDAATVQSAFAGRYGSAVIGDRYASLLQQ